MNTSKPSAKPADLSQLDALTGGAFTAPTSGERAARLREGFPLALFNERTGLPLSRIMPALQQAEAKGWIERDLAQLRPTERGFDFLSDLQELFLPDEGS